MILNRGDRLHPVEEFGDIHSALADHQDVEVIVALRDDARRVEATKLVSARNVPKHVSQWLGEINAL
jgi:hypothetical protein